MDVAFQNTRGAVNATARRLARDIATVEFVADEYDELQDDGTFREQAAFTLDYKCFFTGELKPEQIERLAAGGLTVLNGASLTIAETLDRYAQRVYVRGFWWRVVEQATNEGVTNLTVDKIAVATGEVF